MYSRKRLLTWVLRRQIVKLALQIQLQTSAIESDAVKFFRLARLHCILVDRHLPVCVFAGLPEVRQDLHGLVVLYNVDLVRTRSTSFTARVLLDSYTTQ